MTDLPPDEKSRPFVFQHQTEEVPELTPIDVQRTIRESSPKRRLLGCLGAALLVVYLFLLISSLWLEPLLIPFWLLFGWIFFLKDVFQQGMIQWTSLLTFLMVTGLFLVTGHAVLKRIFPQPTATTTWKWRQTKLLLGLLLSFSLSGICCVAITHESIWSAGNKSFKYIDLHSFYESKNNLKYIGLAVHNYHDTFDVLPGIPTDSLGNPTHSWATMILPFMDHEKFYGKIDLTKPWNHAANQEVMNTPLDLFKIPELARENSHRNTDCHYAANGLIFRVGQALSMKIDLNQIPDGITNTLFFGEVQEQLRPWGDPANIRNPEYGLNKVPYGFGGPFQNTTQFLMGDGSVRRLMDDIDPHVLELLSRPDNGIPEDHEY